MTEVSLGRIQRVPVGESPLPACCAINGEYVDVDMLMWGMFLEGYGEVMICVNCAKEIARAVGFVPEGDLKVALAENISLREHIVVIRSQMKELEDVINSLRRLDSHNSSSDLEPIVLPDLPVKTTSQGDDPVGDGDSSGEGNSPEGQSDSGDSTGEKGSFKQTPKRRSSNLLSFDSSDPII